MWSKPAKPKPGPSGWFSTVLPCPVSLYFWGDWWWERISSGCSETGEKTCDEMGSTVLAPFEQSLKASWLSNSLCAYFLRRHALREKGKSHSAQSWCLSWFSTTRLSTSSFSTPKKGGSKMPIFGAGADLADKDSQHGIHTFSGLSKPGCLFDSLVVLNLKF